MDEFSPAKHHANYLGAATNSAFEHFSVDVDELVNFSSVALREQSAKSASSRLLVWALRHNGMVALASTDLVADVL